MVCKRLRSFYRRCLRASIIITSPSVYRQHPPDHTLFFLVVSLLVVPIVIIMASYSYIFIIAWKQRREIQEEDSLHGKVVMEREMNGACTVAFVVGTCLVSFISLLVVVCLRFFTSSQITMHEMYAVYLVASLNACWNPLIYCWRNENIRSSFKRILKCCLQAI